MNRFTRSLAFIQIFVGPVAIAEPVRLDPGVELQKQQQEQLIQRQLEAPKPELATPAPTPTPLPSSSSTCIAIRQIDVEGFAHLSQKDIHAVTAPYQGRCATQADISQLLQAINAAYVARGYITSRAYLPEQKVEDGRLRLLVLEGRIASIKLNDHRRSANERRAYAAFPSKAGTVFRLQDVEQGVDQINRAPSAQAAVVLEPGLEAGTTNVIINSVDDRTWRAGLMVDNSGEAATGRIKITGTLDKDNLLEINDTWQLALSRTERSRAFSLSPVFPFGYWTVSGSYSRSDYSNSLGNGYKLNGDSHSALLNLERIFFRNQTDQLSLVTAVSDKDSARDVAGINLLPDQTSTLRIGVRWLHREPSAATWFGQLSYVRGTDWFSATEDPSGLPSAFPHHQFNKIDLQGQYSRTVFERWLYSSQLQTQYSNTGLIGGEQLVLGGNDSVRGFSTSSSYGDSGISWRNQLGTACVPNNLPRLQCFVFADAGTVRALVAPPSEYLLGSGAGARIDYPHFYAEASAGFPVYASTTVKTDGGQFYVQLGARY